MDKRFWLWKRLLLFSLKRTELIKKNSIERFSMQDVTYLFKILRQYFLKTWLWVKKYHYLAIWHKKWIKVKSLRGYQILCLCEIMSKDVNLWLDFCSSHFHGQAIGNIKRENRERGIEREGKEREGEKEKREREW